MKNTFFLSLLVLGLASAQASTQNYNFEGTVKLSNCSGALVRFEQSKDSDKGLILTNGHCWSPKGFSGMMLANAYKENLPAVRKIQFLKKDGSLNPDGVMKTTTVLYAAITGNDVAIYELEFTFAEIKAKLQINPFTLDSKRPTENQEIDILSGFWQKGFSCSIDGFVFHLQESDYIWNDSIRYSRQGCEVIGGTSGSPIMNRNTGLLIGVNNTVNVAGEKCSFDNPCEVNEKGEVYADLNRSYGQQIYLFYACLNGDRRIDLNLPGCQLFH